MSEKKYGCIVYEDVFSRLNKRFNDEALGRIMRAAYNYGFYGVVPELKDPTEDYACADLMSVFDRNRDSFIESSIDGQIGNAIKHAKDLDDFKTRLEGIEGLANYQRAEWVGYYRNKYPDKCK